MEKEGFTPQPAQPSGGVEGRRQPEQVTAPAYQSAAAPAPPKESRLTDPPVGTDGQLVEAGYGHGV